MGGSSASYGTASESPRDPPPRKKDVPVVEDDEDVSRLWARERSIRREATKREGQAETGFGHPKRNPQPVSSWSCIGHEEGTPAFFGAATSAEEVEVDTAAKVSAFLQLYREEMARSDRIEDRPKATSGAPVAAGVTASRPAGVDREDAEFLNRGARCTLPRTAAEKARPAFVWLSREASELYWRHAGPGASGRPEEILSVPEMTQVGTKGATLVVAHGGGQLRLAMSDATAAREWARALVRVGKQLAPA